MEGSIVITTLRELGPWAWLIAGLILLALELIAPGAFMVWLGLAALVVGLASFVFDISWQVAWMAFAILSVGFLIVGRAFFAAGRSQSDRPNLNARSQAMVGRELTLTAPISDGQASTKIGDTMWRVQGPDLPSGTKIKVVSTDGATLIVEPV